MLRAGGILLGALLLCAPAQAQQTSDPFTLEDVKQLYRVGLKLKFISDGPGGHAERILTEVTFQPK